MFSCFPYLVLLSSCLLVFFLALGSLVFSSCFLVFLFSCFFCSVVKKFLAVFSCSLVFFLVHVFLFSVSCFLVFLSSCFLDLLFLLLLLFDVLNFENIVLTTKFGGRRIKVFNLC